MHRPSAFSLSVRKTEEVENIVRSTVAVSQPRHPAEVTRTDASNSSATRPFSHSLKASLHRRQHLVTTCIHDDRRPLRTPRGQRSPNGLKAVLPAEIKLRDVFLMTRVEQDVSRK